MRKILKAALAFTVVLALAAGGAWLWLGRDGGALTSWLGGGEDVVEPAAAQPAPPATPVETAEVASGPVSEAITVAGTLRANESVGISVEVAGVISAIHFTEGEPVEAGGLLFELDDSIWRAELAQAEARLALGERNSQRINELFERGVATERSQDEVLAEVQTARAAVGLARARLEKATIKAPFSGILGLRTVSIGEYVSPGQTLVNLEDIEPIKADFRVSERFLTQLENGQSIQLAVESVPGRTFDGTVMAIDPKVDQDTRSVSVRAQLPNQDRILRPGQFARVSVIIEQRDDALLIPEQSLMPRGAENLVFRVVDGKAELVQVEIGRRRDGQVEIVSGLAAGDVVVTGGHQKIQDGAAVQPVPGDKVS